MATARWTQQFWLRNTQPGRLGLRSFMGTTGKVTILGAGNGIGNGGDDFEWIDSWRVFSKKKDTAHVAGETSVPHLRGDALLVEKSEAASAFIYWNGKRYVWSQRGD